MFSDFYDVIDQDVLSLISHKLYSSMRFTTLSTHIIFFSVHPLSVYKFPGSRNQVFQLFLPIIPSPNQTMTEYPQERVLTGQMTLQFQVYQTFQYQPGGLLKKVQSSEKRWQTFLLAC